jgi:hypothetical protein
MGYLKGVWEDPLNHKVYIIIMFLLIPVVLVLAGFGSILNIIPVIGQIIFFFIVLSAFLYTITAQMFFVKLLIEII